MDILHVKFCLLTIENLKIFKLCVEGDGGRGERIVGHLIKLPFKDHSVQC